MLALSSFSTLFGAAFLMGPIALAQESSVSLPAIVVKAKRIDIAIAEPGPSTTVIHEAEISRAATVGEILRDQPGLRLNESGPIGQPSTLFVRGAPSEQTLVLLDGIEINDPTSTSRGFDFANLSTENIERIEIFRGPESLRFGAAAAGGVVNIVTKHGEGPLTTHYLAEGGSFQTGRATIGVSGSKDRFHYSLAGGALTSEGFSAARGGREADGTRRYSLLSRFSWELSPESEIGFTYRALFNQNDLDFSGGVNGDDPNYVSHQREHSASAEYKVRWLDGHLNSKIAARYSNLKRDYDNDPDPAHTDDFHESFRGEQHSLETRQEYTFNQIHAAELVLQYKGERSQSHQLFNGTASRLEPQQGAGFGKALIYKMLLDSFTLMSGLRHDDTLHSGSALTYSVVPTYTIGRLSENPATIRASFSTGFRAPSLYQLYSSFGSRDLKPENTKAWEASFEQQAGDQSTASLTYFENRYSDLIDFNMATSKYANIARAKTSGVESRLSWTNTVFSFEVNHTYLEAKDERTGLRLLRRPAQSSAVKGGWTKGRWDSRITFRYTGPREDSDPTTFQRTNLPAYEVLNLELRYTIHPNARIHLRGDNVLNRRYEDTAGYASAGASFCLGVSGDL